MDSESGVTKFTRKLHQILVKNPEIPRKIAVFTRAYRSPKNCVFFRNSRLQVARAVYRLVSHRTTLLSPNRAVRPSDSTGSPPTPPTTMSPSDRPVATVGQPPAEHSREPSGDPSARVFEVFLIVSQLVLSTQIRNSPPFSAWYG